MGLFNLLTNFDPDAIVKGIDDIEQAISKVVDSVDNAAAKVEDAAGIVEKKAEQGGGPSSQIDGGTAITVTDEAD